MESPAIAINVDLQNPGQFFACCGLLEFADRLWNGAEAWFTSSEFFIRSLDQDASSEVDLHSLINAIASAPLCQLESDDDTSSPIKVQDPFNLLLDWWNEGSARRGLKVWAGRMDGFRIACAMQNVMRREEAQNSNLLNYATIVYDPVESSDKVEPFYFDARRGTGALPIDIGFSPDPLKMKSLAYPAVEFLCLAGLQRFRPQPTDLPRVFDYFAWSVPLVTTIASAAACGILAQPGDWGFRFENSFRTDQRKHKGFSIATPLARRNHERSSQEV